MQGTGCHCSDMAPTVIETLTQMPESVQVRLGVYLRRSVTVVRLQILYYAWYRYIMYIMYIVYTIYFILLRLSSERL